MAAAAIQVPRCNGKTQIGKIFFSFLLNCEPTISFDNIEKTLSTSWTEKGCKHRERSQPLYSLIRLPQKIHWFILTANIKIRFLSISKTHVSLPLLIYTHYCVVWSATQHKWSFHIVHVFVPLPQLCNWTIWILYCCFQDVTSTDLQLGTVKPLILDISEAAASFEPTSVFPSANSEISHYRLQQDSLKDIR